MTLDPIYQAAAFDNGFAPILTLVESPDEAALVQAVADAVAPLIVEGKVVAQTHAAYFRDVARAALAAVREADAR